MAGAGGSGGEREAAPRSPASDGADHDEPRSLAGRATRGMIFTSLGSLAARGLGFLTTIGLTHLVSRAEYGRANAAHTLAEIIGAVSRPLVLGELIRRRSRFEEACGIFTAYAGGSMLVTGGVAFALAGPLCGFFNAPGAAPYLRVALLIPLTAAFTAVAQAALTRDLRFGALGLLEVGGALANAGGAFGLALAGARGLAIIAGQLGREVVIRGVGLALAGVRWIKAPGPGHTQLLREMVAFGLPVYASVLCELAATHGDNLFVSRVFGPAVLGPYAVAYTIAYTPVYTVMQRVSAVILATVARMEDDRPRRRHALLRSLGAMMILVAPAVALLITTGPRIAEALFPGRWSDLVGRLITALALVGLGLPVQFIADYYFQAIARPRLSLAVMASKAAALFGGLLLFGRGDVVAAAWSVGAAFAVIGVVALALLMAVERIPLGDVVRRVLPAAGAGGACALGVLAVSSAVAHLPPAAAFAAEAVCGASAALLYLTVLHRGRLREIIDAVRAP